MLKAWNELCRPWDVGGLDFQKFQDINLSILAKLAWKVALGEEKLWSVILKRKYLKKYNFFNCVPKNEISFIWWGILGVRELIRNLVCYYVGNDRTIRV